MKTTFLAWTPFTGLGLYGGFRGNRWLRNRITIFKQFVIPSLMNQTDRDFIHWVAWRPEERNNKHVIELKKYMDSLPGYKTVFTFGGLCMWDDKFDGNGAREKLTLALHRTLPELLEICPETKEDQEVQVLLVPSDDIYREEVIEDCKKYFENNPIIQAVGFKRGYMCRYDTKELREYNPKTNPPFFCARFPRDIFFDVNKHLEYISMKEDEGKYKAGTPYPSHEYIPNAFRMDFSEERGFMVGTHGENISTHFNNPYGGPPIEEPVDVLKKFGIYDAKNLRIPVSIRKQIMRALPYKYQRKLRYIFGEKLYNKFYQFIRN